MGRPSTTRYPPCPGWAVGRCLYPGEDASWQVAAIDLRPRGRQAKREAIDATGTTEIAALDALAALLEALRGMPEGRCDPG